MHFNANSSQKQRGTQLDAVQSNFVRNFMSMHELFDANSRKFHAQIIQSSINNQKSDSLGKERDPSLAMTQGEVTWKRAMFIEMLTAVFWGNRILSLGWERLVRPHISLSFVIDGITYGILFTFLMLGPSPKDSSHIAVEYVTNRDRRERCGIATCKASTRQAKKVFFHSRGKWELEFALHMLLEHDEPIP